MGSRRGLTFQSGVCESDADLASQYADTRITSGDNPIFEAYKQQIPNIASQLTSLGQPFFDNAQAAGATRLACLPILSSEKVTAVVALYF